MNWVQALDSLGDRIVYPPLPDVSIAVVERITATPRPRWWRHPVVLTGAVATAVVVLVVGLIPAARDQVASWFGIGGVTIETIAPTTAPQITSPPATSGGAATPATTEPVLGVIESGLGEGLRLGQEIVSLTLEGAAGFRPLYPGLGLPDREFVDDGGRAWLLYSARPGLPETAVPGVGMIVTEFQADSAGIIKQISTGDADFVEFGEGIFGVWLPGPHQLVLPEAAGSAVNGRSAGNTLLWEQDGLTLRIETALSRDEAVAIAETFE
jgi:hypothetical protein